MSVDGSDRVWANQVTGIGAAGSRGTTSRSPDVDNAGWIETPSPRLMRSSTALLDSTMTMCRGVVPEGRKRHSNSNPGRGSTGTAK